MKREITDLMVQEIDKRLEHNGLAKDHISNKNARGLLVEVAACLVGIKEQTGNNDGFLVNEIQDTVGDRTESAWCMSFVQTCIAYVERKLNITSRFPEGEHCQTIWKYLPKDLIVKNIPLPGAIAIWAYPGTSSGHTEIVRDFRNDGYFSAVGGNTSGSLVPVKSGKDIVNREGNGVFYTWRKIGVTGKMKLLGFAKPF